MIVVPLANTAAMSNQLVTRHRRLPVRAAMNFREWLAAEITLLRARARGRRTARKVRATRVGTVPGR